MRLFAALVPPLSVREDLDAFLEPRRAAGSFRWTPVDQLHLTLAFMPQVHERSLDRLIEELAARAERRTWFQARVGGGGAFPDPNRAKVLYAGLESDDAGHAEADLLARATRNAAVRSGTEVDGRRFSPHLTLARMGRPSRLSDWVRLLDSYSGPVWPVTTFSLIASHLGEGPNRRPRYETLAEFGLGATAES